jgi:hypothetical protein
VKKTSSKTHWLIDLGLMVGFLAAFYLNLTGINLHQWLGLAVTFLALVHLILHWDWIVAVISRFFMKTCGRSRVYLLLDVLLMVGATVIFETGLVISTWFNLNLTNYADWLDIHVYSSVITLGLTVLKLGLHWRWIVNIAQKSFSRRRALRVIHTLKPVPVPIPVNQKRVDRRQFLVLMGAVGGASVLAASNVLSKVKNVQSAAVTQSITTAQEVATAIPTTAQTTTPAVENITVPTATPTALPQVASVTTDQGCNVRCPRGCSYPGHCRRYTDSNNNNRCDLGECL